MVIDSLRNLLGMTITLHFFSFLREGCYLGALFTNFNKFPKLNKLPVIGRPNGFSGSGYQTPARI